MRSQTRSRVILPQKTTLPIDFLIIESPSIRLWELKGWEKKRKNKGTQKNAFFSQERKSHPHKKKAAKDEEKISTKTTLQKKCEGSENLEISPI